ncbi:MAG TPA: A24 family peptidase [Promineifilum sp.]|nr:A24 family peptidase [Promineifilum sp.]
MPIAFHGLVGLFVALLINRAADCWLNPAPLQCGLTRHPARRTVILIAMPALLMLMAQPQPDSPALWPMSLFAAVLVLLAVIDWEQRRIPNAVSLPVLALAWGYAWQGGFLLSAVAGTAVAFASFAAFYALGRRMYGIGALGGSGAVAGGGMAGAAVGIGALSGRIRRGDTMPYGTYLAVAAAIFVAAGFRLPVQ